MRKQISAPCRRCGASRTFQITGPSDLARRAPLTCRPCQGGRSIDAAKAVALYEGGMPASQIVRELESSKTAVYRAIQRAKVGVA